MELNSWGSPMQGCC